MKITVSLREVKEISPYQTYCCKQLEDAVTISYDKQFAFVFIGKKKDEVAKLVPVLYNDSVCGTGSMPLKSYGEPYEFCPYCGERINS